jgi:hypothetical protein
MDNDKIEASDMTEQEAAEAFAQDGPVAAPEPRHAPKATPASKDATEPDPDAPLDDSWCSDLPKSLKVPEDIQVAWLRIRGEHTNRPNGPDRVIVCWPLDEVEEKAAVMRTRGDNTMLVSELSQACIRMIDGFPADRTGTFKSPGSIGKIWREIGPKGRAIVRAYYSRTHTLSQEESTDFFMNCFVTKVAADG